MIERPDLTRLERTLRFRTAEKARSRDFDYWLVPVLFSLIIGLNVWGLSFGDDLSRVGKVANIVWCLLFVILSIGEGLYAGIYWRTSESMAALGRKARFVSAFMTLLILPPFCAAWGIDFSEGWSYDWRIGGLVGGCVGVVILFVIALYLRHRYRNLGLSD